MTEDDPLVVQLSTRQLAAYNRCDLDAFLRVFITRTSRCSTRAASWCAAGWPSFARATARCSRATATCTPRSTRGWWASPHVVERERWSRVNLATGARTEGTVLVRYTELEGLLRWAEFLPLAPSPSAALARESG